MVLSCWYLAVQDVLYGALLGAPLYMTVHSFAAKVDSYHWMFVIGGLLMAVVLFVRGGILGFFDAIVVFSSMRNKKSAK
jgi:ABC-type branched-subunit amino acid transport system permease subunit